MRLRVLAVGNRMPGWVDTGFAEYAKRMPREARMELIEIRPEKRGAGKNVIQIQAAEADRITAAVPAGARRIVLDERGKEFTTLDLARELGEWMGEGRDSVFIIGGADGLHAGLREEAEQLWALSRLTLPHGLVRVLLAEQLYRAWSITQNHPYHRE